MATKKKQLEAAVDNLRTLVRGLPDDDAGSGGNGGPAAGIRPALDNQATAYGAVVLMASMAGSCWCVTLVHHLTPVENQGKHGVYVRVYDGFGRRVRDPRLRIMYSWEGQQPWERVVAAALDKGDGPLELGHGMIDINWGQRLTVWLTGDEILSDRVTGLHSMHPAEYGPDGDKWNYEGHHSFLLRFQRVVV